MKAYEPIKKSKRHGRKKTLALMSYMFEVEKLKKENPEVSWREIAEKINFNKRKKYRVSAGYLLKIYKQFKNNEFKMEATHD
ncbi:MAG: hypothetical protein ACYCTB_09490 [bacterium]